MTAGLRCGRNATETNPANKNTDAVQSAMLRRADDLPCDGGVEDDDDDADGARDVSDAMCESVSRGCE